MRIVICIVIILLINIHAWAAMNLIAPPIDPLPHDQVSAVLEKLKSKDDIKLSTVYQSLIGPQLYLRALAATYLGEKGNPSSIPYLIDALQDCSVHVGANYMDPGMASTCYRANKALIKITGKDFGFVWNADEKDNEERIIQWQRWYLNQTR